MKSTLIPVTSALAFWVLAACSSDSPPNVVDPPDPPDPPVADTGDVVVDGSVRYQTIVGWEAVAQAGQADYQESFLIYSDTVLDMAVFDLGLTRFRVSTYAGIENSVDAFYQWLTGQIEYDDFICPRITAKNDNADPNDLNLAGFSFAMLDHTIDNVIRPLRQRIASRGESLYFTLDYIAPPQNNCTTVAYPHDNEAEYAEFILAVFLHMQQKYGFVPDAVEMVNEPEHTRHWRSGTKIGQAMVAAGDRLKAEGFTPDFIAPSNAGVARAAQYFDAMISVPGTRQYVTELSYHRYDGVSLANLQAIGARGAQYGIRTAMLEHIGSGHEDLHTDLTVANVSSWEQYTLAFGGAGSGTDAGGAYFHLNVSDPSNPVVTINSRTKMLRQYFRYVRPGAVRVGATTKKPEFDPVAFINTNDRWVVVVKASTGGSFEVEGLPAGTYGITYATANADDVALADVTIAANRVVPASIPAAGVVTIFAK